MRRILAATTLVCALAATAARAVRLPNDFAQAHWLLDYRYGLIKRGLAGSLLGLGMRFGLHPDESAIAWISFALFAALLAALVAMAIRILSRFEWSIDAYLVVAVFLTSPFVVTAAHLVGYLDHPNFLLTLAAVWVALEGRLGAAGAVAAIGTLVHEAFVLVGLPLVVVAAVARPGKPARLLPLLAPPALACAALFCSETFLIDRALLRTQLVRRLSRFPFIGHDMNVFLPEWLTTTIGQNLEEEAHHFTERLTDPHYLALIVPSAAALWLLASRLCGTAGRVLVSAAIAAPLLLHLLAWDTARIWTYPLFAAFGCLWIAVEAQARRPHDTNWILATGAGVVVVLNVLLRYPLLDGEFDRFTNLERLTLYAPLVIGVALLRNQSRASEADADVHGEADRRHGVAG